jgi:hypothetical protein
MAVLVALHLPFHRTHYLLMVKHTVMVDIYWRLGTYWAFDLQGLRRWYVHKLPIPFLIGHLDEFETNRPSRHTRSI